MDALKVIVFNRWYLIFISIFYCFLLHTITKNKKNAKYFKNYSIVLQCLFLIFYFYMAFQLATMNSSNYDFFAYGLSIFYILGYMPFFILSILNFQNSDYTKIKKITMVLICILIGFVLYYPFILLTYGFAP